MNLTDELDDDGVLRSARSQMIIDTIERALEKMIFVEANLGRTLESKDLFQVKKEAKTAVAELKIAAQILTGQLEF